MESNSTPPSSTEITLRFELFPTRTLTLLPYHNVKNSPQVFAALRSGKIPGTGFLNPAYILSPHQIHVAANKALFYETSRNMTTKELTTETLYIISAQRNKLDTDVERELVKIGASFKEFGIRDERPQFVAFVYDATDAQLQLIRDLVQGDPVNMSSEDYTKLTSVETITKHYKIEPLELELGTLETAVVNRIVVKDV